MTNWTIDTKERLYQKLADEIFFRVLHGKFPLGSKLPSRTVLIREANTSQDTLRKALVQLASQKVLFKTRQGKSMNNTDVPIWEKYTLTIEEASKYFRVGENKLRKLAEENPTAGWVIMNGNRIQIKRKQFEKIIDSLDAI